MSPLNTNSPTSKSLSIAIPASFIDIIPTMAQKTRLIGRIARTAAIARVGEILVYPDISRRTQASRLRFITHVLKYLDCPQYLRKHLFSKSPELRYAGVLPPLRTPHHPVEKKKKMLQNGTIREGYAFRHAKHVVVDVGVENPLPLRKPLPPKIPSRVTVQILRTPKGFLEASLTASPSPQIYWGYHVTNLGKPLGKFLNTISDYNLVVATSRKGAPVNKVWNSLQTQWQQANRILVLFGSPEEGLESILQREGYRLSSLVDVTVNIAPTQGVATIRTEEAVLMSLTVFRILETF